MYTKLSGASALIIAGLGAFLKWTGAGKYTGDHDYMSDATSSAWNQYAGENAFMSKCVPTREDLILALAFALSLAGCKPQRLTSV